MSEIAMNYGWYEDQWRANPLQIGISSTKLLFDFIFPAVAGFNRIQFAALPVREIYVITVQVAKNNNSGFPRVDMRFNRGTSYMTYHQELNLVAGQEAKFSGTLPFIAGDILLVDYYGVTAGDNIDTSIYGYVIDISE